ncbi:MAG: (Fe-S)-binding protein [Nitrososphaerota archaeon]
MAKVRSLPLSVKQMIELDGCVRCEICREECSLYRLLNSNPHPLGFPTSCGGIIRRFRPLVRKDHSLKAKLFGLRSPSDEEVWELADALFLNCSLCGRCSAFCPIGIETPSLITSMREYFMEILGNVHCAVEFLDNLHRMVNETKNVFGVDNSARTNWSLYTGVDVNVKDSANVVYFVGCISSYQGRAQDISAAITSILNYVGEDWTLLKDEACCGHPLTVSGGIRKAVNLVRHNLEQLASIGAKTVVTGCPGCYLAIKHEWPKLLGREFDFEVLHFTELLNRYITNGKLKIPILEARVTYHDPCELGRLGGIIEEPRKVIKRVTREFIEPYGHGMEGICCGSGGMLKALNPELSGQLAIQRLKMLKVTEPEYILSACPTCVQAFASVAPKIDGKLKVLDLSQLIAQQNNLL